MDGGGGAISDDSKTGDRCDLRGTGRDGGETVQSLCNGRNFMYDLYIFQEGSDCYILMA